jgi:hypothetical protein
VHAVDEGAGRLCCVLACLHASAVSIYNHRPPAVVSCAFRLVGCSSECAAGQFAAALLVSLCIPDVCSVVQATYRPVVLLGMALLQE